MNIFVTFDDPFKCAEYLDDKRLVKMCLETTQLLCTSLNEVAGEQVAPYKTTHKNHPCAVWARASIENYRWLKQHARALMMEYQHRFNKVHACTKVLEAVAGFEFSLPDGPRTPFPNCARHKGLGIEGSGSDVHECYRDYLRQRWLTDKKPAVATVFRRV